MILSHFQFYSQIQNKIEVIYAILSNKDSDLDDLAKY